MSAHSLYEHLSITASQHDIRLLRVLDTTTDSIEGLTRLLDYALEIVSMVNAPPFVALSYEWGNPWRTSEVLVNGNHFEVRQNLFEALTHIQKRLAVFKEFTVCHSNLKSCSNPNSKAKSSETVYLWIDALCIDQSNVNERTHQLHRMDQIFSSASFGGQLARIGERQQ